MSKKIIFSTPVTHSDWMWRDEKKKEKQKDGSIFLIL